MNIQTNNSIHSISAGLREDQFKRISQLIYDLCGINLKDGKEALVRVRLMKRIRALRMESIGEYLSFIERKDGRQELGLMVDVMTTNKTSFFREPEHFNYLAESVLPDLKRRVLRFWSAACSSGEEPYSLAIVLRETMPDIDAKDVRILATDISTTMLERARRAVYGEETIRNLPERLFRKYLVKIPEERPPAYRVIDKVRAMVSLAWLNLIDSWPMKGRFNVIFCRNVMIYFDRVTQQRLIERFWNIIEDGGYLFVGHSEGLSAISHKFRYVRPAVYRK